MIPVSDTWKATMDSNTAYTTSATISLASGTVLTVTPADVCVSGNRFTDGAGLTAFPVGAAMSRTMQINLDNSDDRYADTDFLGAVIRLYLNYGTENISIGKFTVLQPETYGETVIITAQDDMYKADKPFASALTYPATAAALWTEICTACGMTDGTAGVIPQGSYGLSAAPSSDLTYRAVLGYIAMLSGGNARVNRMGQLEIVNYDFDTLEAEQEAETAEDIHDLTMWRSLRLDTEDVTITGVQTTVYDGEGSTTVLIGSEGYVLALDNPLFAAGVVYPSVELFPGANTFPGTNSRIGLETAAEALIGRTFRGFSGEYIAYPLAEFGDGARITDRKGNTYYTVITDVDFTWGAQTTLQNSAESPLRNASKYAEPTVTTLQRAAQMVAAEKTAREAAVSALADALAASGGMYVTTEAASGGGTIYYLHDKATLAASGIVLKLTAEALGISTDGGSTYPYGVNFATSTAILNILQANGINADWINAGTLTVTDANSVVLFRADKDSRTVQIGGMTAGYNLADFPNFFSLRGNTFITLDDDSSHPILKAQYGPDGIQLYIDPDGTNEVLAGSITQLDASDLTSTILRIATASGLLVIVPAANDFRVQTGSGASAVIRRPLSEIGTLSNLTTTAKGSLVAAINEVDADVGSLIQTKTITATTSAYGYIGTSTVNLPNNKILSAIPTNANYVALPYSGSGLMVYNRSNMAVVANTSVTVDIIYI